MIRIGINGSDLEGKGTGVKRYLSSVLPHLNRKGREYYVYSRAPLPEGLIPSDNHFISRPTGESQDKSYTFWEQIGLPRFLKKDSIDIFFSAGYSIPLSIRIPSMVVIHDISFSAHPEWFGLREGLRRRLVTRLSARKADRVITVSDFSRRELIERYHLDDNKIVIAPNGVTSDKKRISASDKIKLKEKYSLGEPVILYVGLLLERRFIRQLIEAFGIIAKKHNRASLVLIGNNQLRPSVEIGDLACQATAERSILHLPYVDEDDLSSFYAASDIFIYLSSYEGFGIPPLEAMKAGVPVITSRSSALEEIYRDSALLVEHHRPQEISEKIELLLRDDNLRKTLSKSAQSLLKKYRWEKTAVIINSEISKLARNL